MARSGSFFGLDLSPGPSQVQNRANSQNRNGIRRASPGGSDIRFAPSPTSIDIGGNRGGSFSGNLSTALAAPSPFEQAGTLQSLAATQASDAEVAGIQDAIAQLQALLGGSNIGIEGMQQGSTVGGFNDRLNSIIGGDQFQGLVDERQRAVQGQLAAGGLTRSGTAIEAAAAVPTELGFQLENQLFGRQSGLASAELGIGEKIANLLGLQGTSRAGGITSSAEAEAGGILGEAGFEASAQKQIDQNRNDRDVRNSATGTTLGTAVGTFFGGPLGGAFGGAVGGLFSDPRLKTNVQIKGKIGPLDLVTWDWTEDAKETIVGDYRTVGFMSDQVKAHYPDLVGEFGGFDIVNYTGLMERLNG